MDLNKIEMIQRPASDPAKLTAAVYPATLPQPHAVATIDHFPVVKEDHAGRQDAREASPV